MTSVFCCVEGCKSKRRGATDKNPYCNRHAIQMSRKGCIIPDDPPIQKITGEIWKHFLTDGAKYEVSNLGRIKSIRCGGKEKILSTNYLDKKHKTIRVACGKSRTKSFALHTLVARTFLPNPYNDTRVVFLDGDKTNCRADNLNWIGVYYHNNTIASLKVHENTCQDAKDIVAYMEGDSSALDRMLSEIIPKVESLTLYWYNNYKNTGYVDIEDVLSDSLLKAFIAIQRGLLRDTKHISKWFETIAKNTLINAMKKAGDDQRRRFEVQSWREDERDPLDIAIGKDMIDPQFEEMYDSVHSSDFC